MEQYNYYGPDYNDYKQGLYLGRLEVDSKIRAARIELEVAVNAYRGRRHELGIAEDRWFGALQQFLKVALLEEGERPGGEK